MRFALLAIALSFCIQQPAAAQTMPSYLTEFPDAQQRAERTVEIMLFDTGLLVGAIGEAEPYMNPEVRQQVVTRFEREIPSDLAQSVRAYMSEDFDRLFANALARARPGMIARIATGFRSALTESELDTLEAFVLSSETSGLFRRLVSDYLDDEQINPSNYTRAEIETIVAFMTGPGGTVFGDKAAVLDELMFAELRTFVPAFEREFVGGLCTIVGGECPSWVNQGSR